MGFFSKKKSGNVKKEKEMGKLLNSRNLDENTKRLKERLKDCDDIVYKEFRVGEEQDLKFLLVYADGMSSRDMLNDAVLNALMVHAREVPPEAKEPGEELYRLVRYGGLPASELADKDNLEDAILAILIGDAVLFIDTTEKCIVIGAKGWPMRGVSEPNTEALIRGPRDGFTETFRTNTALVRRRIRDSRLKLKQLRVGKRSFTDIGIMYIEDIASPELLEEVFRRIDTIDIDAIIESGYIEQLIEDNYMSPFPQISVTERPDEVAASLYEGRVAILVDNSPFALIVPTTLNSLFQSPEDYYDRWYVASILRFIRYMASILSLVLPASYIAVTSFHPGILPAKLVISMAAARQGIPFPVLIEAFIMEVTFELLREAGLRLPVPIGSAIGIVGGIVIGSAAVEAGIVSPIMVIIVAITAISSFSIPNYSLAVGFRMLRFLLMIFAGTMGLYGIMLGVLLILSHLVKLKSFGIPYMSPYVSFVGSDFKDTIIRVPAFLMAKRPVLLARDKIRLKNNRNLINRLEQEGSDDKK
ncbi:MAG TPA: spore germination protein [Bacillota bacterium]|nr:spore germination protein [Clostridiaceae bacterium]HPX70038.1 spore germination protein [Bacillota bacterium]HQA66547.1 spore germination protein [Bacillota bacterium]